jgi:hypothetical protein
MIYDVAFFERFYQAEKIDNYKDLLNFFASYTITYYQSKNIYYEEHAGVYIPIFFHFRLHLFAARESTDLNTMIKEYKTALSIINPKVQFIQNEIDEAKAFTKKKICKGKTAVKDMRQIIHLNTMTRYKSIKEAAQLTGYEYNSIRRCCNEKYIQCKGQFWAYYDKLDFDKIYENKKSTVRRGRRPKTL